jgi:hypothetical protein
VVRTLADYLYSSVQRPGPLILAYASVRVPAIVPAGAGFSLPLILKDGRKSLSTEQNTWNVQMINLHINCASVFRLRYRPADLNQIVACRERVVESAAYNHHSDRYIQSELSLAKEL